LFVPLLRVEPENKAERHCRGNASKIRALVRFHVYNYKIYFRLALTIGVKVFYISVTRWQKAHRLAVDLPPPLLEYVKALAGRRGLTMSGAIVLIVGDHMDLTAAKAAGTKSKITKGN
jgi:hypothetical protein